MGPKQPEGGDARRSPTPPDEQRRRELAEFLRTRRSQLNPERVGLPVRRRRRTPGLRREDVAERAGVSTAWYTYLEQARPIHPSRSVVAALADALCLPDTDRTYLFSLTRHTPPRVAATSTLDPELLQRLIDHLAAPAYCTDAATNVLAWNQLACEVFGDYATRPPEQRNLLRLLFTDPEFAQYLVDRDEYAARVVRTFRDRSNAPLNDPAVIALVEELREHSLHFQQVWDSRELRRADTDTLEAHHPNGRLTFTMITFQDLKPTGVRFTTYLPADLTTVRLLQAIQKHDVV
ncbi:helix-turn-helix transcriptional regulator [Actinoallomurus sp. NBC_01490]|jgi:transcriptional regulator with XRE-family HTH domain|uniref:helix-turn-helix transcriptional regulator n=1 Tax=Actinoallomurus sp. NBC_01490 TaxID=2903557 RepID=UPI002E32D73E|nr:helix-turn-helix transcriptional regulator [Actinoallomurus sp. NBC_01490]